jgi:RNA polymerase sigma-70 factor (ECF subfamily)
MSAVERGDLVQLAELLAQDVRATMPPYPEWFSDRESLLTALARSWDPGSPAYVGAMRMLEVPANGQLGAAGYVRSAAEQPYLPFAIGVLRIADGRIAELTAFHEPALFAAFLLPPHLDR